MITDNDLVVEQSKRLQLAREHAGYKSARMAALRMGWKYPTYSAHENGTRKLTPAVANKYSKAFNVLAEFLLFGSNPPDWYGQKETIQEKTVTMRFMRLFTERSLTAAANLDLSNRALAGRDFALPDSGDIPPNVMAYKMQSDEMHQKVPTAGEVSIFPGDILIAETMPDEYAPGDVVIIYDEAHKGVGVRKVKGGLGGDVKYVPLNDDFMAVTDTDAIVIGKALIHLRRM